MITPKEAAARNDEIYADQLEAAEKILDGHLASRYSTGRRVVIDGRDIPLKDWTLRKRLMDRYRKAGWKVEKHDCQKEGLSYSFSAPS